MPEDTPKTGRKGRPGKQANRATGAANPKRVEARAKRAAAGGAKPNRAEGAKTKSDTTARELIFMVSRVANDFEAMLKTKEPALSLSQWAMLEMLSQETASARPSQIARKLGFSRQLVRQATKKLTSLELIAKDAPEEGKKAVGLKLSDAGRKTLSDINASTDALSETLKADKRGAGVNQAARTLKGLSAAMPKPAKERKKKANATDDAPAEGAIEA